MEQVLAGPGTVLAGCYTIERELGRGGTATVFLARDLRHHRPVAIKILRPEVAATLGSQRFLREIEIAARLTHPHILPLHDSGDADGVLYYVMPFVEGESLQDRLRREEKLPLADAIRIAREVADALAYAHSNGIVHRDIKPGNILLESGHAVVADFGIARAVSAAAGEALTTSGLAIGTPMYMSPEQISGAQVDGRSDIYSLGCVLYEMLTGQPPFGGADIQMVASRHLYQDPAPLSSIHPAIPAGVVAAIENALAKRPEDRFPNAQKFADALTLARPHPISWTKRRRNRALKVAVALLAVTGTLFAWRRTADLTSARQPAWVLLADFEGPPRDRGIADMVRELVAAELDQSRDVATMPRQQVTAVMRDAGLSDTVQLTPVVARELAFRSSVRAILTGSVRPVGAGQYSIILRVLDADTDKTLLSLSDAATEKDLVAKVQQLGRRVRRRLGERRSAIEANKPLAQVATPSFEAYRKYVDALELARKGDVDQSNRLLREALARDTGFAAAWASLSVNYANARDVDSSRLALVEALKRPERLSTALRYKLEAEAAYRLRYDLGSAVRWYELHLAHAPQSLAGHNNRAVYLSSMGRYEEALEAFRTAVELDPFGPKQAEISLFNEIAMLLALGRLGEASERSRHLTGSFADYAALLQATFAARWSEAESLAGRLTVARETPPWLKTPAATMWAGSLAARGAVDAATRILRDAAAESRGPQARWYRHAELLLVVAAGLPSTALQLPPSSDTTPGGMTVRGLVAAVSGEPELARQTLETLEALPPVERLRLGDGPRLIQSWIAAREGRWTEVIRVLAPGALRGEHDGSSPDQVASVATRWLVANAYERTGRVDSAAAYLELAIAPTRVPFSHLALRGLVYPFGHRRLAILNARLSRPRLAQQHGKAFAESFITPDPDLRQLTFGAGDWSRR